MFIEIEKKFELTDSELNIIRSKLKLSKKEQIEDVYMDTTSYQLTFNRLKFRTRNGQKELKVKLSHILCEEYYEEEAIKKLKFLGIDYKDMTEHVCTIKTLREKYKGKYKWKSYVVDVDEHWYGKRYEIEVECENEEEGSKLIDNIVKYLWLNAVESKEQDTKFMLNIKNQNKKLYKIIIENNIQI